MISQLALDEIDTLRDDGLWPYLEVADIIRINAFALKCELNQDCASNDVDVRVAWLPGGIPLYQPTLQSEIWMSEFAEKVASNRASLMYLSAYACHHARILGFFEREEMIDCRKVTKSVRKWQKSIPATYDQICAAVDYAVFGNNPAAMEPLNVTPERRIRDRATILREQLRVALSSDLKMSRQELLSQTYEETVDLVTKYRDRHGLSGRDADLSRARVEFYQVLEVVRCRAMKRKDAANGK